jgi:hypothetical protein
MPESLHDQIKRERDEALPEASLVQVFRNYAKGRQRGTLSAAQRAMLKMVLGQRFADNVCLEILRALAGRVTLTRWQVDNAQAQAYLDELWVKAAVPNLAAKVHFAAPRDGNAAVALNWLPERTSTGQPIPGRGRVTLHREPWWDGKTGVFIARDSDGQPVYAVKDFEVWLDQSPPAKYLRRTVYFPERIERYILAGEGWKPYPDLETYRQPWVKRNGQPLHIPIVQFIYDADHDTDYGISDLDGGILGLQDEINDIQRDITAAAQLTGYQQFFLSGVQRAIDQESGKPIPFTVGPGMVHHSDNSQANMKVLGAGSIEQLVKAYQHKQQTVAHNTSTPLHLITGGDWPSGSALIQADIPLRVKADRFITSITPPWGEVPHRAVEIANTFGGVGIDEDALIVPVFEDTQRLDDLTKRQIQAEEVALYADLLRLPEVLIQKTGILTKDELSKVVAYIQEKRIDLERALARGDAGPVIDDEDEEDAA